MTDCATKICGTFLHLLLYRACTTTPAGKVNLIWIPLSRGRNKPKNFKGHLGPQYSKYLGPSIFFSGQDWSSTIFYTSGIEMIQLVQGHWGPWFQHAEDTHQILRAIDPRAHLISTSAFESRKFKRISGLSFNPVLTLWSGGHIDRRVWK